MSNGFRQITTSTHAQTNQSSVGAVCMVNRVREAIASEWPTTRTKQRTTTTGSKVCSSVLTFNNARNAVLLNFARWKRHAASNDRCNSLCSTTPAVLQCSQCSDLGRLVSSNSSIRDRVGVRVDQF